MSTKNRVVLGICSLGLLAAFIGGCHAEAKIGNPEPKAATPPPPAPPPPPPPPAPPPVATTTTTIKSLSHVHLKDTKIEIDEQVQFDQNKATIKPESNALLDEIAKTMKDNEKIKKVQVEGHTSSEGDAAANMKLSDERAKAVMKALADRGVDAKRMIAKGYGVTKPIGPNDTETGRIQNRRVEFTILDPAPPAGAAAPTATKTTTTTTTTTAAPKK